VCARMNNNKKTARCVRIILCLTGIFASTRSDVGNNRKAQRVDPQVGGRGGRFQI
jgi:hypothetical protein